MQETLVRFLDREDPMERDRLPSPVFLGFPCGSAGKDSACNAGDLGLIPGLGRSSGEGHGNPLQYSCLENPHGQRSLAGYSPWNSLGQNTGMSSFSLVQGIFPTPGSNPGLLHCRWILYQLSHKGSPRILDWAAYPFSRGSSQPRDQTQVSCIAGGFFTS